MSTTDTNEPGGRATAERRDLELADLINFAVGNARLMYTTVDVSGAAPNRLTVTYGGTTYVMVADPAAVTIAKVEPPTAVEPPARAAGTHVSDERVQEILDHLNSFVDREYDGGTHLVNGKAMPCSTVVGCDANLDKAVDWALEQTDVVANAFGPDADGSAEVELVDGTVIKWFPTAKQWSVTVSDDTESEVS